MAVLATITEHLRETHAHVHRSPGARIGDSGIVFELTDDFLALRRDPDEGEELIVRALARKRRKPRSRPWNAQTRSAEPAHVHTHRRAHQPKGFVDRPAGSHAPREIRAVRGVATLGTTDHDGVGARHLQSLV